MLETPTLADPMMRSAIISDFFFNLDHAESWVTIGKDGEGHYDESLIQAEAVEFVDKMEQLGVAMPMPEQVAADFFKRL